MFYYKTREQVAGEAIGGIIGLFVRFFIWSIIYSPFVFAFVGTIYLTQKYFITHWFVSAILGLIASFLLLFVVGFLVVKQRLLKRDGKAFLWIPLLIVNLILISGLPFCLGISFGLGFLDPKTATIFEQVIAGGFGGGLFAVPSYIGVTKNIGEA